MDGFGVDPAALSRTVDALHDAIGTAPGALDRAVEVTADAVGHAGLADGIAAFGDRWDDGVSILTEDAREMAARLARSVDDYLRADRLPDVPPAGADPPATG